MPFPMQRCFQTPDLFFGAFDHLFPRIRSDGHSESHPHSRMQFTPILGAVIPQAFDSMRYGNGMTRRIEPMYIPDNNNRHALKGWRVNFVPSAPGLENHRMRKVLWAFAGLIVV